MSKRDKGNLAGLAYDRILEMILKQEIRCGEKIPEEKLTQMLGMSRTPVREAIRKLSSEGVIIVHRNRVAEVITFDESAIRDLGLMRIALDTLAGQLAVIHGSNADFMGLKGIADLCYEAARRGDIYNSLKLDSAFHLRMTEIAGNPILLKVQRELYLRVYLVQAMRYSGIEDRLKAIETHSAIVDSLLSRNEDAVIAAIRDHLSGFYHIDFVPQFLSPRVTVTF